MMRQSRQEPQGDGFSTFYKKWTPQQRDPAPRGRGFDLLSHLEQSGPTSIARLRDDSGLPLLEFAEALGTLRSLGLVEVEGEADESLVSLTDPGHSLTRS